jgi:hypothetical protein
MAHHEYVEEQVVLDAVRTGRNSYAVPATEHAPQVRRVAPRTYEPPRARTTSRLSPQVVSAVVAAVASATIIWNTLINPQQPVVVSTWQGAAIVGEARPAQHISAEFAPLQ